MPALFPTSSELARKALMTSGPAATSGQDGVSKVTSSLRPARSSASSWRPVAEAIVSSVPGGTVVGRAASGAAASAEDGASSFAHAPSPTRPTALAAETSRKWRRSRVPAAGIGRVRVVMAAIVDKFDRNCQECRS
jgi:hypothetical protein